MLSGSWYDLNLVCQRINIWGIIPLEGLGDIPLPGSPLMMGGP